MAKRKQNKQRKQIKRQTRHFQLRVEHPVDQHVAEILDYKRTKRSEVTAIRDGVRLLWALENNDLSILFEMFPHLKSQFTPPAANGGGQLDEIKGMLEMIAAQQKTGNGYLMSPKDDKPPTGKQIAGFKALAAPVEDDDQPTVLIRASTSTDSSMNFVSAMRGMQ